VTLAVVTLAAADIENLGFLIGGAIAFVVGVIMVIAVFRFIIAAMTKSADTQWRRARRGKTRHRRDEDEFDAE